jgi:DNA-binding MarR family transcriptional regulator
VAEDDWDDESGDDWDDEEDFAAERSVYVGPNTARCKAEWRAARRWRCRVESALEHEGCPFSEWLVLDALRELSLELADDVNQNEVAARTTLERSTVSRIMHALEAKELVSRGPDLTGRAWRIYLTGRAVELLTRFGRAVEVASAERESGELSPQMVQDVDAGDEAGEVFGFAHDHD